jgi:CheY-like chemotaxis protein
LPLAKSAEIKALNLEVAEAQDVTVGSRPSPFHKTTVTRVLAVTLVEQLRPRVVVMDINMPRMNGIEATARIKTHRPETIIIGISVNTGHDNHKAMKQAGAVALLTKEAAGG